jgi:hypothetical protein
MDGLERRHPSKQQREFFDRYVLGQAGMVFTIKAETSMSWTSCNLRGPFRFGGPYRFPSSEETVLSQFGRSRRKDSRSRMLTHTSPGRTSCAARLPRRTRQSERIFITTINSRLQIAMASGFFGSTSRTHDIPLSLTRLSGKEGPSPLRREPPAFRNFLAAAASAGRSSADESTQGPASSGPCRARTGPRATRICARARLTVGNAATRLGPPPARARIEDALPGRAN